jgi:hypothetical protein
VKESPSQAGAVLTYCNPKTVASLVPVFSGLSLGPVTKVNGERAQAGGQLPGQNPEQLNFSGINASVRISPPTGTIVG